MIVADRDALGGVILDPAEVLDASPEWLQRLVYYVTGDADFILAVTVRTVAEYEALTRRLFFENRNVKHFRTFVAMQLVKAGLDVRLARVASPARSQRPATKA